MELKNIVCDFEYAEKLAELGIQRESLFGFCSDKRSISFSHKPYACLNTYTVTELGEMLVNSGWCGSSLDMSHNGDSWVLEFWDFESNKINLTDEKEANARAKLLIWLIENDHVNVEDLNKEK